MLEVFLLITNILLLFIGVAMFRQLRRALHAGTPPLYTTNLSVDAELPSVTVCIPARNEAHALMDCLQKVIASEYEKLEIIVLDDVSGDDTSALIKSFAAEGVRFVQGSPLKQGWLGKNHALQGLLNEASGTYVLFMDVDTRLEPRAVEHLVRYAMSKRTSMVSVLPRREDGWRTSIMSSPLRYFWEIVFHRRTAPSTASNAWLIQREVLLKRFDGFHAFKNAIQPESKIAAELALTNDYQFLIGSKTFGIAYEKKWRSQLITSTRLLYPLLSNKISVSILGALSLFVLLIPFVTVLILLPLTVVSIEVGIVAGCVALSYSLVYGIYTHRVWHHGWILGALMWPLIVLQEIILVIASIIQYQRRTVKWKGRLIQPEVQS